MNRLIDKRALITGGTSGIGLETARQFLDEGARVAITGRTAASLDAVRKQLGGSVLTIQSDAGDVASQLAVAEKVQQAFGALDVLFINAGMAELKPIEKWEEESYDRNFAVNVKGPYFLVRALLPFFARPATIIVNGSVNAHIGMPNTTVYAATKAALTSLTRTLSGELIGRGIRVNAVSPGPIATPFLSKIGLKESEVESVAASIQGQVPLGRFGTPEEIARAVVFLASDESAFTVGSEFIIDGGMTNL
jgi:NAD(P)-dependent dehydrogenase (short-subunit alcohol dehydrogenase family)